MGRQPYHALSLLINLSPTIYRALISKRRLDAEVYDDTCAINQTVLCFSVSGDVQILSNLVVGKHLSHTKTDR